MYRYRTGVAWRDLPARFGPWQTVWKRHARFSRTGTWDRILHAPTHDTGGGARRQGVLVEGDPHRAAPPRDRLGDPRTA
ncbi:MAG TPA: transposase [Lapillicoccus sp.]|nr:transposase [Lapillicoccus sp.]